MSKQLYHQTGNFIRFLLRRDKIRLPIWLFSLIGFTILLTLAMDNLYPTQADRNQLAETMINPAVTAMIGPGYGLDSYTLGAMIAHQMLGITALVVGIMSILLVVRHTRADEEEGRLELFRSLPSGRLTSLAAVLIVMVSIQLLLALTTGFGLYALGFDSLNLEGSLLYGAALGAVGIFFTAITALFAQLSETSRGSIGLSFTVLGLAYLFRAIGDVSNETLSWFSPFGWALGTEVYVNNYWWPLLLTVGVSLVLIILTLYLNAIRDMESGFLPSRPGRKHAAALLQSPTGLVLRLQRTSLVAWSIAMLIFGATYGSVLGDTEAFFEDIEMMEQMLPPIEGVSLTEQFLTMLMTIMALISTVPALMVLFKLKSEENAGRIGHLLSRTISRKQLLASYFLVSVLGGFVMLSCSALGIGLVGISVLDGGISLGTFYQAAIVYLPAIWLMIGFAVLLLGVIPKIAGLAWLYLGYSFVVVYMGGMLQLPNWLEKLTPFGYIPQFPVEEIGFANLSLLSLTAAILMAAGFAGFSKRDIQG
ncbi:ABC transporter permease [Sediminibacillus albus]|uniref:ABC-2 type transport system permease protein n=1 Tax=Sediminibacillus albus TaxID=407036 RepID=A0A1G8WYN0_9BACI|nr:ABC transporter permease [Sediminibacillus albus]SDJ83508.1 ABC-2 type transport system permease protein [Sediminibacillus albus]